MRERKLEVTITRDKDAVNVEIADGDDVLMVISTTLDAHVPDVVGTYMRDLVSRTIYSPESNFGKITGAAQ
jgi:hypothetical protein